MQPADHFVVPRYFHWQLPQTTNFLAGGVAGRSFSG
jgi:hypothetical protein